MPNGPIGPGSSRGRRRRISSSVRMVGATELCRESGSRIYLGNLTVAIQACSQIGLDRDFFGRISSSDRVGGSWSPLLLRRSHQVKRWRKGMTAEPFQLWRSRGGFAVWGATRFGTLLNFVLWWLTDLHIPRTRPETSYKRSPPEGLWRLLKRRVSLSRGQFHAVL